MAQNKVAFPFLETDMTKVMRGLNTPQFDMQMWMETGRKNFQAFTNAQQLAIEAWQTYAQRQTQMLSQMIQDNTSIAQALVNEGTPEAKVIRQTDVMKKNYEKALANLKELNEILSKSGSEAADVINKRITATLNEVKSTLEKNEAQKG